MNAKTMLLLPSFILLLVAAGHGQGSPDPGSTATALTREMSNRLQLNEGQYVKLHSINRMRLQQQQEIERTTTKDASARTAQLAELQEQYEQECARILTPSQLSQLQQQDQAQPSVSSGRG
jgi:hypothetical protein